MIDELLKKFGLTEEELSAAEWETLSGWLESLKQGTLTVEKIREYVSYLKDQVEDELTKYDLNSKQDLFLKARLKNYKLLEAFLTGPEKAKKQLERVVSRLSKGAG